MALPTEKPTRKTLANSIRALAIDAIEKANSGHPGMPMGMADIAEVLWNDFLRHSPENPDFYNRDRFILSNGHGSMLHYALLHLTGYDVSIQDIQHFRQLHSTTPGHPEYGITPGIESTTGPLGQGLAHAVGMALAEKLLATEFNRENFNLIDHYTYVFLGDGCLMEGISHEVCSLAGTWQLGKLILFWDNNGISIDGQTQHWFTDHTPNRFRAYGFHVIDAVDGHDPQAITDAIIQAKSVQNKPSLICCQTTIGFGSPNQAGTATVHGSPLGKSEVILTKQALHWPYPDFYIPPEIYKIFNATAKGKKLETEWQALFQAYQLRFPALASELLRRLAKKLPDHFKDKISSIKSHLCNTQSLATRKASQNCIQLLNTVLPELLGGSADLTPSNLTFAENTQKYIHYGVREFGMSGILGGIALHGGYLPFGGTFLVFSDYARNAVRLAAIMKIRVIFVYTHDSIGLGEDGPTHQPIEHIEMLRATPNLHVWRPCDMAETFVAWQLSVQAENHPSCLLLSRQTLPAQKHEDINNIYYGAYVLYEHLSNNTGNLDIILIATGSEVQLAMSAAHILVKTHQKNVRVVSMPCMELFLQQPTAYQETILPLQIKKRIAIEAGSKNSWYRWTGFEGHVIGLECFGESAPAEKIYQALDMTVEKIIEIALS